MSRIHLFTSTTLIALACLGLAAATSSDVPPPQDQPTLSAEHSQFDFWLGEWDVFGPDGRQVGTNSITSIEGGAALLESWSSAAGGTGGTGTSFSYYDQRKQTWKTEFDGFYARQGEGSETR